QASRGLMGRVYSAPRALSCLARFVGTSKRLRVDDAWVLTWRVALQKRKHAPEGRVFTLERLDDVARARRDQSSSLVAMTVGFLPRASLRERRTLPPRSRPLHLTMTSSPSLSTSSTRSMRSSEISEMC